MRKVLLTAAVLVAAAPAAALSFTASSSAGSIGGWTASNLPAAVSATNLVQNGSFETGDFSGWEQVNDTSSTFVTTELAGGGPTDGSFHAAFGPIDPAGGGIIQAIATTPGSVYRLSFDLANLGGTPNAFGIFWDGSFVSIDFDLDAFDYTNFFGNLVATGASTELGFIFYNEPSFFLLDNVTLSVVPEPATWAMLIAGFGMVGAAARRRTRAAVQ